MQLFNQYWGLVIGCLMLLPVGARARQEPPSFASYNIEQYDDENGLSSNDVTGFFEDLQGYYWFATQYGLVRFDGRHFIHFSTRNTPVLLSNKIYAVAGDAGNNLLFCDETARVYQVQHNGQVKPVPGALAGNNFLMSRQGLIIDMRQYMRNMVDSVRITQSLQAYRRYETMPEFYKDANGNTWFIRIHELSYFRNGYFNPIAGYNGEQNQHFYSNNTLFVVNTVGNVQAYKEGERTNLAFSMQSLLLPFHEKEPFDAKQASFCSNTTGTFLRYRDKLFTLLFDGQTVRLLLLLNNLAVPLSREVFYSKRYRMYIMITATQGFYLVREQAFTFRSLAGDDLLENVVTASVEVQPMQVLATNGLLFTKDTVLRKYSSDFMALNTILKDREQRTWFLGNDTLFCMNSQLKELKRWVVEGTHLKSIQQDDKGTIWYCTHSSLARIDSGQLRFLYQDYPAFGRAQCMFFMNDTSIWIGTTAGLFVYHKNNNTITSIPEMANNYVRHIYRARDSTIWISTYGQGFFTWRNGRFLALPMDRNHNLATAHCFMEDDGGFFWIPTNKGLFQVAKAALEAWLTNHELSVYYHYYDKRDGFASNEFNGGSSPVGIRMQDGTFSLPSMKGLVWFDPLKVEPLLPVENIYIDRVILDSQEVVNSGLLRFEAGIRKISFRISSPFFGNRDNFLPEYKLSGVDNLWSPVPADNTIRINYLAPGRYALEIRLRKGFGAQDYTTTTQSFSIAPHFYETLAFRILAFLTLILLFIACIYSMLIQRAKNAKQRELHLEREIQQRTRDQAVTLLQLEHAVAALKVSEGNLYQNNQLKDKLTSVVLHNIRSPLRFMNMLSNRLHLSLTTSGDQPLTALTAELKRSSDQLDFCTREFQLWLSVQQPGFRLHHEYVLIQDLFREAEESFRNLLNYNNNNLHVMMGEDIHTWTDRQLLKTILYNLIDNANKRTEKGLIGLMVYLYKDKLTIRVADSGKEMTLHELHSLQGLLEMEKHLLETKSIDTLGYSTVPDLVRVLRGRIGVKYTLNTGTTVSLILPE